MKDSQGTRARGGGGWPALHLGREAKEFWRRGSNILPPGQALSIRLPSPSLESRMLMWHAKFSYFRTVCMHRRDSQGGRD